MRTHPPDPRLRRLLFSSRSAQDPIEEHVSACDRCRHRIEALGKHLAGPQYDAALAVNKRRLDELQSAYTRERSEARSLVAEVLKHPAERQRMLIFNHPRFQTWGVFEHLIAISQEETSRNPKLSEDLAKLALDLSEQLDTATYGTEAIEDLRARAWSCIANSHRVRFELREARDAFDRALLHLRKGTREPWELAVWLDLKASMLRAQRRFDEAMKLLRRALVLFLAVGDRHRAGRTLISMDHVLFCAGQAEKGIPLLYQALDLIDPDQDPRLLFSAKHNLIDNLADAGRHVEAQRLLMQARGLYRRFDEPAIRNRRLWVEGKIARGIGRPKSAEELLMKARAGFQEQGATYEFALVCLELAGLYAEQGRTAEMKQLAEEMVPIFSSRQIHREALAALALWCQAAKAETAGAELAAQVAAAIRRGREEQMAPAQETA